MSDTQNQPQTNPPPSPSSSNGVKSPKPNTRQVLTDLVDREEVMRFLAVAEAVKLPALLEGEAGVGKTKSLTDYAKAYNRDGVLTEREVGRKTLQDTFILEVDEGTRPGEVKGRVDMKKLLSTESEYELISPITSARFVLINEIDKATAALRNSFLGIMNEKFLFNGQKKVKCQWEVFVATCNKIPEDEKDSPFWDRFVLKMKVKRVQKGMMLKYWENQASKQPPKQQLIKVPTDQELAQVRILPEHLSKFMDVCYSHLSDRTLSYVPRITAAITYVYKMPVARALVKCAEILVDYNVGKQLANMLEPKEVTDIRTKIDLVMTLTDNVSLKTTLADLQEKINQLIAKQIVGDDVIKELVDEVALAVKNNPLMKQQNTSNPFNAGTSGAMQTPQAPPQLVTMPHGNGFQMLPKAPDQAVQQIFYGGSQPAPENLHVSVNGVPATGVPQADGSVLFTTSDPLGDILRQQSANALTAN